MSARDNILLLSPGGVDVGSQSYGNHLQLEKELRGCHRKGRRSRGQDTQKRRGRVGEGTEGHREEWKDRRVSCRSQGDFHPDRMIGSNSAQCWTSTRWVTGLLLLTIGLAVATCLGVA